MPPIARDGEFVLTWIRPDVAVLAASYEDILAADASGRPRVYTVTAAHANNRVVPRRELPKWNADAVLAHWQRDPDGMRTV